MSRVEIAVDYAKRFIGRPYIWGGSHPSLGYDCSGFVQEILASVGFDPKGDQTAQTLFDHFQSIDKITPIAKPETAAILFFGNSTRKITHVSFAIDELHMIEAGGGGSKTLTVKDAVKDEAFIRIRPIFNRKDLVACLLPKY